jgi:hypothetical protein
MKIKNKIFLLWLYFLYSLSDLQMRYFAFIHGYKYNKAYEINEYDTESKINIIDNKKEE